MRGDPIHQVQVHGRGRLRAKGGGVGVEVPVHGRGICDHVPSSSAAAVIGADAAFGEL